MKRALPLVLLAACLDSRVDYVGKRCSSERPCPGDLECSAATQTCQLPSTCEPTQPMLCAFTDVALAPGMTPPDLQPGTRLVLQNADYGALRLTGSGTAGCPVVLAGPARFTDTLTIDGSHWRVSDLTFEVPSKLYALTTAPGAGDLVFQRLTFSKTATSRSGGTEYPFDVYLDSNCSNVTITESQFTGTRAPAIFGDSTCSNVTVRGNRFVTGRDGPTVQLEGQTGIVEGNDLSGTMTFAAVEFVNGGSGVVRRNWFHDLTAGGLVAVRGAREVVSNTFTNVETAASCGTFRNNVVQRATNGVTCGSAQRAFNLYDDVASPGALEGSEVQGAAQLGADGVPGSGSPAVDAADPQLPVPSGGGARADIGAFERGATRLPDGSYCFE
ncbi:MAG: right-handed parallel beta-helix repeat-containing protein [Myxococcaceae bacterium]|nr:right-handed parallel beta-helix repeat-containing protein [Myxococcaceae bacterium]